MKHTIWLLFVLGCEPSALTVREPSEVVVRAKPPAPVVETPRVVVEHDRIRVTDAIYFETDRAAIRPASDGVLDEIAQVLEAHPELIKIRIEGHTDSFGSERTNRELSRRRAVAVRAYLIDHGVDARRLVAEGLGSEDPIADNDTEEGRAKNRRVAFTIVSEEGGGAS